MAPLPPSLGFVSIPLNRLPLGEELPAGIYLELGGRPVLLRASGDRIDYALLERLTLRNLDEVFVRSEDFARLSGWLDRHSPIDVTTEAVRQKAKAEPILRAREDAHRTALDIFRTDHPDPAIAQAIQKSKKLVLEIIRTPYAVRAVSLMQAYSRGTIDHSLNVSILSTYLALRLGYTHNVMLQHIGLGALLHDIGKRMVRIDANMTDEQYELQMRIHPQLGSDWLEGDSRIPKEVKLIVAQHHEAYDGSGYPKRIKGTAIFDLARIVAIANTYDELVADASGSLEERQAAALKILGYDLYSRFEPRKLERVKSILKKGV